MTNPNLAIKYASMSVYALKQLALQDAEKAGITPERALYIKLQMSLNEDMPFEHRKYREEYIDTLKSLMKLDGIDIMYSQPE